MIYITGDCHGDYRRFNTVNFPEQKSMTKSDYVIVCGDFGFWEDSKEQKYWMNWLNRKPFTTLFVAGNHDNYDLLNKLPVEQWNGGKAQFIAPSIIHLMRGQIFDIDGMSIFAFGGASSHDIEGGILEPDDPNLPLKIKRLKRHGLSFRINHTQWWAEELPSDMEMNEGIENLKACGNKVDFIISHCCATSTQNSFDEVVYKPDRLTNYFDKIKKSCDYQKWFFGHYHDNRNVNEKEILIYEQVIRVK